MGIVVPFPLADPGCTNPRGEVIVYACEERNGCWAVEHMSKSGDNATRVGTWLGLDEAMAVARDYAEVTGCDFPQGRV